MNGKGELQTGDGIQFQLDVRDPNLVPLKNHGRTQWVEVPVRIAVEIVAKIVIDHVSTPLPRQRNFLKLFPWEECACWSTFTGSR